MVGAIPLPVLKVHKEAKMPLSHLICMSLNVYCKGMAKLQQKTFRAVTCIMEVGQNELTVVIHPQVKKLLGWMDNNVLHTTGVLH